MSNEKILEQFEEAPHIEINEDGSTIDLANWSEPANRTWSYRNSVDIFPYTARVSRGDGPVHQFGHAPVDLSPVEIDYRGRPMLFDEYLYESHSDGVIVIRDNEIVYENYRRMVATDRHLCQSVSKTTLSAVIGNLVNEGLVDPTRTVDHYVPEVASGFAGIPLQNLLDMNVALDFSEDFTDPAADIHHYEMITGWHPGATDQRESFIEYAKRIEKDKDFDLNGVTHYLCPNTDMLGYIAEQLTGKRFAELFEDRIYRHIGAEADAFISLDVTGMAVCSGGWIVGLRDLARYGQVYANLGVANDGTQVIPRAWLDDCRDTSKGTDYYLGRGFKYHNQMTSDGESFCHLGVGGQILYANPPTKTVVAQFSTTSMPSNGDLDFGNALYDMARAVNKFLSN